MKLLFENFRRYLLKEEVLFHDEGGPYTKYDDYIAFLMENDIILPADWTKRVTNSIVSRAAMEYSQAGGDQSQDYMGGAGPGGDTTFEEFSKWRDTQGERFGTGEKEKAEREEMCKDSPDFWACKK